MAPKTRGQMAREGSRKPRKSQKSASGIKKKDPVSDLRKKAEEYWKAGNLWRQEELKSVDFKRSLQEEIDACKKRQAKKEKDLEEAQAAKQMSVVEDADLMPCYIVVELLEVSFLKAHPIDAEQSEILQAADDDLNDSRLTLGLDEISWSESHDAVDIEQDAVIMANEEADAPTVPVVAGGSSSTQDPHPLVFLEVFKQQYGPLLYVVKDLATGKRKRIPFSKAFKDAPQAWAKFVHKQLAELVDQTT